MKNKIMVLILIPIFFILTTYAKFNLSFAEFYAVKIYPVFAGAISFFTSKISVSLAEIIIVALIILLIIYTLSMAVNSFKHKTT
ncbi:MAG: hypothetical protein WBI07_00940, partial [Mobilitalea sp.]